MLGCVLGAIAFFFAGWAGMGTVDYVQGETGSVPLASAAGGGVFVLVLWVVYAVLYILPWVPFVLGAMTAAAVENRRPQRGRRNWLL